MTNKLLFVGGIIAILGYLALLIVPVSKIPLLDANRQVLVESEAGGQCAGQVYVDTRGEGSEAAMSECLESSTLSTESELLKVQPAFCQGLIGRGLPLTTGECLNIMTTRQLWPTVTGTLTLSWNARFPYPLSDLGVATQDSGDQSRTGEREDNEREGFGRE